MHFKDLRIYIAIAPVTEELLAQIHLVHDCDDCERELGHGYVALHRNGKYGAGRELNGLLSPVQEIQNRRLVAPVRGYPV